MFKQFLENTSDLSQVFIACALHGSGFRQFITQEINCVQENRKNPDIPAMDSVFFVSGNKVVKFKRTK